MTIDSWLKTTIIGLELCPFAKKPYVDGKIQIEESPSADPSTAQEYFLNALDNFQAQNHFETLLLVYPEWHVSFRSFYDFSQDCEGHLNSLNLEDEYQLVAFHPEFCFEGLHFSDRANLVNSSPYPLIHILRTNDLDLLQMSKKEAKNMSFSNAKRLDALSEVDVKKHFPWRTSTLSA